MAQDPAEDTLIAMGKQAAEDIIHRAAYDPAKAREYYLRTRHLKGRRPAAQVASVGRPAARGASNAEMRLSRRKHLEAEKAKLEKRIEELKNALESLVRQAKRRAGVKASEDSNPKEQADRNTRDKKDKPLTEKQKADKRKASKEQYEKEKGMTLSREVEALRKEASDIRAKLEAAIADANRRQKRKPDAQLQKQSTNQTASNGR